MNTRQFRVAFASLVLFTAITGCGGGGSAVSTTSPEAAPPASIPENGQVALTLTDAEGDFVAYIVDVTSILLTKSDGSTVETLPAASTVDFTQLTDVSEFFSVTSVPTGTYDSATITLDYTNAAVVVQLENGEPVEAIVTDTNGDPISRLAVNLTLADDNRIRVTAATIHALSLDFDIDASNTIDDTTSPPTVVVEPVLLATPSLDEDREHRLRGQLQSVDITEETVALQIRPFQHRNTSFGEITFNVTATTRYDIDDVVYEGSDGLQALATLALNSPVVASGTTSEGHLVADSVVAGDSVFWAEADVARGLVTARDATTLTLRGVTLNANGELRPQFSTSMTIVVGDGTEVSSAVRTNNVLDQLSVSVGQALIVTGTRIDDSTLDASAGKIRMQSNKLWGDVVSRSPLVIDLQLINGRRAAIFDFSGTGSSEADDSDPDAYEFDTADLSLAGINVGEFVQARGLVNRFGFAPPDFTAQTVIDLARDNFGAIAKVGWPDGSGVPFTAVSPDRIDLALDGARVSLKLKGRFRGRPITPDQLALVAPEDGTGIYSVGVRGDDAATLYRSFEEATNAMTDLLNGGASLFRLSAHGSYTDSANELIAGRASFIFARATQ